MTIFKNLFGVLVTTGALSLAACESGGSETSDAVTESDTTASAETGAPTSTATEAGVTTGDDVGTGDTTGTGESGLPDTTSETGSSGDTDATTDETGDPVDSPEIAGMYIDGFGSMHVIDAKAWKIDTAIFHLLAVDNETDHLVARNDAANEYNPDLYSRFDWHVDGEDIYYCQIAYDAPEQEAAESTPAADGADLMMGCDGFPWSSLTP